MRAYDWDTGKHIGVLTAGVPRRGRRVLYVPVGPAGRRSPAARDDA